VSARASSQWRRGRLQRGRRPSIKSLLHFVGIATWSDEKVLAKVREMVLPAMRKDGPIEAWIIDDTSFPKQGKHSVGVHHQYCGQLGKQANCQVTVSLSIANHSASLPVGYRLYLPKDWTKDRARRKKAGVPSKIGFKTKDRTRADTVGVRSRLAARCCINGRGLWQ
jgi:SRSO17 transposase